MNFSNFYQIFVSVINSIILRPFSIPIIMIKMATFLIGSKNSHPYRQAALNIGSYSQSAVLLCYKPHLVAVIKTSLPRLL